MTWDINPIKKQERKFCKKLKLIYVQLNMSQISYCWYCIHVSIDQGLYFESNICKILNFLRWRQKKKRKKIHSSCQAAFYCAYFQLCLSETLFTQHISTLFDAHQLKLNLFCNYFCFLTNLSCKKKPESSSDELNLPLSLYQLKYFWGSKVISVSLNAWH